MSKHNDKMAVAAFGAVRLVMQQPRPTVSITPVAHQAIPAPISQPAITPVSHVAAPSYSPPVPTPQMIQPYAMGSGNVSSPSSQQTAQQAAAIAAASRAFTIARLGSSKAVPIGQVHPALTAHPADLASTAFQTAAQKAAAAAVLTAPLALVSNAASVAPDSMASYAQSAMDGSFPDGGAEPQYQSATDAGMPSTSAAPAAIDDGSGQSVDWSMLDDGNPGPVTGPAALASLQASAVPGLKPNAAIQSAIAPAKLSLWERFLAFLGFGTKTTTASVHGESSELQSMVESVVRRARNGDQNAMALIALVRDNAKTGHPKAQETFTLLQEYIRTNPVGGVASYPRIGIDHTYPDAVALSHGPLLTNPRIGKLLTRFGGQDQHAIRFGIENRHTLHAAQHQGVRMGRILAHARRLQAVRMPHSSLSKFDHRVGWELGEK